MWYISLHRKRGRRGYTILPAFPRPPAPILVRERRFLLRLVPIPLTGLELDIWRPMRPDEVARVRVRPMEGEITPHTEERLRRMWEAGWRGQPEDVR